ncbi:MAG: hypothetical protein GY820_30560 [Gammaproteobacteria bacterium]|nr:hypothetical protein [Gammaproteobacteria bacterium]
MAKRTALDKVLKDYCSGCNYKAGEGSHDCMAENPSAEDIKRFLKIIMIYTERKKVVELYETLVHDPLEMFKVNDPFQELWGKSTLQNKLVRRLLKETANPEEPKPSIPHAAIAPDCICQHHIYCPDCSMNYAFRSSVNALTCDECSPKQIVEFEWPLEKNDHLRD